MEDIDQLFIDLNKSIDTSETEVKLLISKYTFEKLSPEFDAMGYCCVCDFTRSVYYAQKLYDTLCNSLLNCRRATNAKLHDRVKDTIRLMDDTFFAEIEESHPDETLFYLKDEQKIVANILDGFDVENSPLTQYTPYAVREKIKSLILSDKDEDIKQSKELGNLLCTLVSLDINLKNASGRIRVLLYLIALFLKDILNKLSHVGDSRTDADYIRLFENLYKDYREEFIAIKEQYLVRYKKYRQKHSEDNAKNILEDKAAGRLYDTELGKIWIQCNEDKYKLAKYISNKGYDDTGEIKTFFYALIDYDYACEQSAIKYDEDDSEEIVNTISKDDAIREAIVATMGIMYNNKHLIKNSRQWLGIFRVLVDYKCIQDKKWTIFQTFIEDLFENYTKPRIKLVALDLSNVYIKPFDRPLDEWRITDFDGKNSIFTSHKKIAKTFKEELDKRYNFG